MKDNDTITITTHGEIGAKSFNDVPMGKFNDVLMGKYIVKDTPVIMEKPTGELVLPNLNNANIDNASSTITLSDNTPIEGILLVRGNITETEGIYTTATIINENNDSSTLLGENAVVEDTTTE